MILALVTAQESVFQAWKIPAATALRMPLPRRRRAGTSEQRSRMGRSPGQQVGEPGVSWRASRTPDDHGQDSAAGTGL